MSLLFDDVSSQYLELVEADPTGLATGTMGAWAYIDSFSAESAIAALSTSLGADNYEMLLVKTDGTAAIRSKGGTTEEAATAATLSLNTWHHLAATWVSDTTRSVFLDGSNKVTDVVSEGSTSAVRDALTVGRLTDPVGVYASGRIGYVAFWSVVLTDLQIASLASGIPPWMVQPESIVAYLPLLLDADPAINLYGTDFTRNGGPTLSDGPPGITAFAPEEIVTAVDESVHGVASPVFVPSTTAQTILNVSTSNAIVFSQTLDRDLELTRSQQNDIIFLADSFTQVKQFSLQNDILFSQTLERDLVFPRSQLNEIFFEVSGKRTILASTSNAIVFSIILARGEHPLNTVNFDVLSSAIASKGQFNSVIFTPTTSAQLVLNVGVQNNILFTATTFAELVAACIAAGLPVSTSILLQASGATDLALRGPEFGNTTDVNPRRLLKTSRGGTPRLFRDSAWPNNNEISFTVTNLKESEKDDVLTFIQESLGKLVTLTDQNSRIWIGIIESPEAVTIRQTTREVIAPGQRSYEAQFNLSGELQ